MEVLALNASILAVRAVSEARSLGIADLPAVIVLGDSLGGGALNLKKAGFQLIMDGIPVILGKKDSEADKFFSIPCSVEAFLGGDLEVLRLDCYGKAKGKVSLSKDRLAFT